MIYTIYKSNGQITRVVDLDDINSQLQPDEQALEGSIRDDLFYIDNGVPCLIPESPGKQFVFDFDTKEWIDPRTPEKKEQDIDLSIRVKRKSLLLASDWTQLPDVPLITKQSWAKYRQALRDITDQPGYPFDIVWPQAPN